MDLPISGLPAISITDPNALLVIVTSGTTYKISFSALTAQITGNVDETFVPVMSSNTTYVSSKIFQTSLGSVRIGSNPLSDVDGPETFGVHASNTESFLLINGTGSIDSALGIVIQNVNSGHTASSDIVAIGDTGDFESGYIDMGVNSSTYSGFTGVTSLGGVSDAYLFSTANDLYIGNATPMKKLVLFNGGFDTSIYSKFYVHEEGSITINTDYVDPANPSALRIVNANSGSTSMIHSDSNINDFAEIISVNTSTGNTASADIVAQNILGETNPDTGYIDMGINGPEYTAISDVGAAGDAYVYSTGNNLYLGNASENKKLVLFNGGFDTILNAKLYIHEDGSITINTAYVDPANPSALRIVNANSGSTSMIYSESNINNFAEITSVNTNSGDTASSQITATNDLGYIDPTQGHISMGINSTGYSVVGSIGTSGDTYMYSTGNDLYIGNTSTNKKLILFNGGTDAEAYSSFYIHPDRSITINTPNIDYNNPAAIRIVNANGSTSMIHADGNVDAFSEINSININSGNNASADIVATNDSGYNNPNAGFVNMGINSSTYTPTDNVGGPNDAYVYGTGTHFHIGNGSVSSESDVYIFTNGKGDEAIKIAIMADSTIGFHTLTPQYPVDISGTTRIQDGDFIVTSGQTNLGIVIEAQGNSDAILSGLTTGDIYRTGDFLKIVH